MSTEAKHTPGPWTVTRCDDDALMIHTEGDIVAFADGNKDSEPEMRAINEANARLIAAAPALLAENQRLRKALERIERWHGEFPETDAKWPDGSPVSYGAQFGSHGERDYMRGVARAALTGTDNA